MRCVLAEMSNFGATFGEFQKRISGNVRQIRKHVLTGLFSTDEPGRATTASFEEFSGKA